MKKSGKILIFILAFSLLSGCSCTNSDKKIAKNHDKKVFKLEIPVLFDFEEDEEDEEDEEITGTFAQKIEINDKADIDTALEYDNIEYLKIEDANIDDFSFLKNIKIDMIQVINNDYPFDMECINADAIKQLYFHNTDIVNQSYASNFKRLFYFTIESAKNNTELTSLDFLKDCKKLTEIYVQNYAIKDLKFAKKLKKLQNLTITNSAIESLDGIENCSDLTRLYLTDSMVSDISALSSLKKVTELKLSNNYIKNVDSIKFKNLTYLNLSDNLIKDASPLSKNPKLGFLDLSRNYISEFPSELISSGISIDLSYNNIKKITDKDKSALESSGTDVNLFDNLLDSSTLKELADCTNIFFETECHIGTLTLSADGAIKYNDKIHEILSDMGDDDDENIMRIAKYIKENCMMDYTYEDAYKDSAYGALFTKAVCTGFTDLTNTLCRHLDIDVKTYHGDLDDPNDNVRHVWSVCNGYHMDAMHGKVHKDSRNYPKLVFLNDEQIETYGYILDAINIPKITAEKSDAERNAIIDSIESKK